MMNSNHLKYIWLLFSELAPVIKYVLSKKGARPVSNIKVQKETVYFPH